MCLENAMQLSLKSDTFSALKEDFDSILNRTLANMEMRGAEDATITLKLAINLEKGGIMVDGVVQDIKKPSFKHDISSVMQVKDKKSGALTGDYQLVWDDEAGEFVMMKIKDGQTSLFDGEENVVDAEVAEDAECLMIEGPEESGEEAMEVFEDEDVVAPSEDEEIEYAESEFIDGDEADNEEYAYEEPDEEC